MLPVYDLNTDAGRERFDRCLGRLRATTSSRSPEAATVAQIIDEVRSEGDEAVVRYMRQWTDPDFSADQIVVQPARLRRAHDQLDRPLAASIGRAIDHVRTYQQHIVPRAADPITIDGAELALRWVPVDSVGLLVPGGTAALFSTLIMLAVPALVAGVDRRAIAVVHPPPTRMPGQGGGQLPAEVVLAVCHMLGIEKVYRIGGAQAVAACALGTRRVEQVQMVAGPGNVFVQLAKAQLAGVVGSDGGFYGPSEIVTIADQSAPVEHVAADLIAQAEHDPGRCFLVAWSPSVLESVNAQIAEQLPHCRRRGPIERSLRDDSAALLVADSHVAAATANLIGPEHLHLAVREPGPLLGAIRNAGEIFLGAATAVAAGDYYVGPSHCLPTGTTARFASGLSVHTFLKRIGTVHYRQGMPAEAIQDIARMAEAEQLDAHARSVRLRGSK